VHPLPEVTASSLGEPIDCFHQSVQLNATGAVRYEWQPQQYCDDPSVANPRVSPPSHTTFYVTGYDENNCSSTDSVEVMVFRESIFFLPNAFSPNADGFNDILEPVIYCDFQLELFNVY